MTWLVTGAAGFIGFHTTLALLARGESVVGVDNMNTYYEVSLKEARLARLTDKPGFTFVKADIADRPAMESLFAGKKFRRILHLAAQAGVRYSLENPQAYIASNILGFQVMIDLARAAKVEHFVFASSSSVYGANTKLPLSVRDNTDHPLSLYAATKRSNELVAHCYAHLYGLPSTGLRYFTVYGPWGRPDMSPFIFTRKILTGEPIELFNNGDHLRDYTYIDDIVSGALRIADGAPSGNPHWSGDHPDPATSKAPYRLYNLGNSNPVKLMDFVATLENALGKEAKKKFLPMQLGDVHATYADISETERDFGFEPRISLTDGVAKFVAWYKDYYRPS